jgi:hypothetical protein
MNSINELKVYGRAEKIKGILEYMLDSGKKIPSKQLLEAHRKLGEALYALQGERRDR